MSSTRDICETLKPALIEYYLDDLSIIRLSMTSTGMLKFVSDVITENMLTSGLLNSELLANVFLFPYLYQGKQYNEKLFKLAFSYMGFLTQKAVYDLEVIEQLINIIVRSGYDNKAHYKSVISNACFFGNRDVLELLAGNKIGIPAFLDKKVKSRLQDEIEAGRIESAERYLNTYQFFIEKQIGVILKEILDKIKHHRFILNGGGDKSISDIDHPIPNQAAKVYKIVKNAIDSGDSLLEEFKPMSEVIFKKLGRQKNKGFIGFGERDASTTGLYSKIMSLLTGGHFIINDLLNLQNNLNKLILPKKSKIKSS